MCKYHYGGRFCAHRMVKGRECVGEKNCLERAAPSYLSKVSMRSECTGELWYGLYCAKYRRFHCPGRERCGALGPKPTGGA